jgi:ubiquinone/menaquinone biosynthesis C-methylase UbiE
MTEEAWQVSGNAAEMYEQKFVPNIFQEWASRVADATGIRTGDRVLDVACGTGIVARECVARVGPNKTITGLDLNEGMLAVARRLAPDIEWHQGDVTAMPFEDRAFNVVVCQFGFMYFPDREKALREMWRVLAPGGRLAVATWDVIDRIPAYVSLGNLVERFTDREAANVIRSPYILGDKATLKEIFDEAGLANIEIATHRGLQRFDSLDEFIEAEIKASPLADRFDDVTYAAMVDAARSELAQYCKGDGLFEFDNSAHIVVARKD